MSEVHAESSQASPLKRWNLSSYGLAMFSGGLLFVADYPVHLWLLHFVALVPLFMAMLMMEPGRSRRFAPVAAPSLSSFGLGLAFSCCYSIPLLFCAGTSAPVLVAAMLGFAMWFCVVPILHRLLWTGDWMGPVGCASVVCLFELFLWHAVPVFGTAQCFARVASAAPALIQFAAYSGLIGVVFVLVWMQSTIAIVLLKPRNPSLLVALLLVVGALSAINWQRWNRRLPDGPLVAALSWGDGVDLTLKSLCDTAKRANAQIIVTPETGLNCPAPTTAAEKSIRRIVQELQREGLHGAIGVFRQDLRKNQLLYIHPDEGLTDIYEKSHLIPFMESYNAGEFAKPNVDWLGVKCGGVICQDDNFSDLSRAHSLQGVQLMLVPTNDWAPIRGYHFDSSRMRAIESGYAIVRAATGGISALISPRGEVVESVDNTAIQSMSIIATNLQVGDGTPTLYARYGDWPVGLISGALLIVLCVRSIRGRLAA
jgi:apolipoprotein N-acyltransferase